MKIRLRDLAIISLAALCTDAAAQLVTEYAHTEATARVQAVLIGDARQSWHGTIGPNLIYCRIGNETPSGTPLRTEMRDGLFAAVYGKSRSELIALRNAVDSAASRNEKLPKLFSLSFGINAESVRSVGIGPLNGEERALLRLGQEVTIAAYANTACYTPQQLDQAIVEGRRVLDALITALPQ